MRRTARLSVAFVVLLAGGGLAIVGAMPASFLGVSEVVERQDALIGGEPFTMKGQVKPGSWTEGASAFVVTDEKADLPVRLLVGIPENFGEGRLVVLTGTLARTADGALSFEASTMQVGCPSKYEAAVEGLG